MYCEKLRVIANDVPPFQAQVPLNRPSVMQHHWVLKYVSHWFNFGIHVPLVETFLAATLISLSLYLHFQATLLRAILVIDSTIGLVVSTENIYSVISILITNYCFHFYFA